MIEPGGTVNTGSVDPSLVALPFEQTYDMLDPPRLFIRITPPDSLTLGVSLEVFFDGERFSSQSGTIGTAELPNMEFVYRYRRPTF